MNKISIGIIVSLVIVIIALVVSQNTHDKEIKIVKNLSIEKTLNSEELEELNDRINYLKERLSSLTLKDEEIGKLKKELTLLTKELATKKDDTKVIKGYQEPYDYINKHALKPMHNEVQTLRDGTPYNIYTDEEKKTNEKNILAENESPKTPVATTLNINDEVVSIIVNSSTSQIAILTTGDDYNQELTINEVNSSLVLTSAPTVPRLYVNGSSDSDTLLPVLFYK